jgi:hypothetical protein
MVLGLALATAVHAQMPPRTFISPSGEPFRPSAQAPDGFSAWFAQADVNHDGKIDRAEFRADAAAFFKRVDANNDGVIDGFEIAAYETKIAPELAVDGPGLASGGEAVGGVISLLGEPEPVSGANLSLDKSITLTQWLAAADRRFDLLDKKRLGYLDRDTLFALLPKPGKGHKR